MYVLVAWEFSRPTTRGAKSVPAKTPLASAGAARWWRVSYETNRQWARERRNRLMAGRNSGGKRLTSFSPPGPFGHCLQHGGMPCLRGDQQCHRRPRFSISSSDKNRIGKASHSQVARLRVSSRQQAALAALGATLMICKHGSACNLAPLAPMTSHGSRKSPEWRSPPSRSLERRLSPGHPPSSSWR